MRYILTCTKGAEIDFRVACPTLDLAKRAVEVAVNAGYENVEIHDEFGESHT